MEKLIASLRDAGEKYRDALEAVMEEYCRSHGDQPTEALKVAMENFLEEQKCLVATNMKVRSCFGERFQQLNESLAHVQSTQVQSNLGSESRYGAGAHASETEELEEAVEQRILRDSSGAEEGRAIWRHSKRQWSSTQQNRTLEKHFQAAEPDRAQRSDHWLQSLERRCMAASEAVKHEETLERNEVASEETEAAPPVLPDPDPESNS